MVSGPKSSRRGAMAKNIRAVLFDLDGTLYRQDALRLFMALELSGAWLRDKRSCVCTWKTIRCFRAVREELRGWKPVTGNLENLQFSVTAGRRGMDVDVVAAIIREWIFERPLKYMGVCRRRGVKQLFEFLKENGFRVGVFSDYPVCEKLIALGVYDEGDLGLCATDLDINAFKPDPKGFLRACSIWGLEPGQVLYVGDRPDVDAAGAAAAGMPCVILSKALRKGSLRYRTVASFEELGNAVHNLDA